MKFLIQDAPSKQLLTRQYGPIYQYDGANATYGKELYDYNCASCHGANGSGSVSKPYGSYPPYLYLNVNRLEPSTAGGTYEQFAQRSIEGVHATLPNMTSAALFSQQDWKNLQTYVAKFEGDKQFVSVSTTTAPKVVVVGSKLSISDRVYFEVGTANLDPKSNALLDEVARVLNASPQVQLIQIEGHTDKSGDASTNIPLSASRAKAVQAYMIAKGVDASRLRAKGYGSSRPLIQTTKDQATQANRRVEFTILKQSATSVVVPVPNNP
jgi:outer membrane protein OmpA-like peptidoglycan-associated protein